MHVPAARWSPRFGPWRASLVLIAILALAACESPEDREARHFERGLEHVEAGDDARAMAEFRNVLRLDPKNADALYQIGLIHERGGRWPQAFVAFREAAAERPGFVEANLRLGRMALAANDLDTTERAALAILDAHPGNLDAQVLDAAVMLRRGDLQRAQNLAEAALAEDPAREDALAVVIGVLTARGRLEDALARIEQELPARADPTTLLVLKAQLLERLEDARGVQAVLAELLELHPDDAAYHLASALLLARLGDAAEATSILRRAVNDLDQGPELARVLVGLLRAAEGSAAAEAELRRLIERFPDVESFPIGLADLLARDGRTAEAAAVLEEAAASFEGSQAREIRVALGGLRLQTDDVEAAAVVADALLADDPDDRDGNVLRGWIDLRAGDHEQAIRRARAAIRGNPGWAPALRLTAEAHLRRGERLLAIQTLRDVVAADPTDLRAAEQLATELVEAGDLDAALTVVDRIVAVGNDPVAAVAARAQIEIDRGNWTAAERDVATLLETSNQAPGAAWLAGRLELARGDYDAGREWFGTLYEGQPTSRATLVGLVRTHTGRADLAGALAFLRTHVERYPDDAFAIYLQAEILRAMDRPDDADAALDRAIALEPDNVTLYRERGRLKRDRLGDLSGALEAFRRGLQTAPDDVLLWHEVAATAARAGLFADAIDAYARLLSLDPSDDIAGNNYAALVADHAFEDPEALRSALEVAQRFRTSNDGRRLDTLGWVHYRLGDLATAVTYLERAATERHQDPAIRYHLGMALQASGQSERALGELRRAVSTDATYRGLEEARAALHELERELAPGDGS